MNVKLSDLLVELNDKICRDLKLSSASSDHPTEKGDATEDSWIEVLNDYLPKRYLAIKGRVVDSAGDFSEQIDIIICDKQYSPLIFQHKSVSYVPAESVYAVFEVKASLNKSNIEYAAQKISSVRGLHRTSLPIVTANGKTSPKELHHILGGLLSTKSEWIECFSEAFYRSKSNLKDFEKIDIYCVATGGLFVENEEFLDKPVAFFIFKIINMLQNIGTVPMLDPMEYAKHIPSS